MRNSRGFTLIELLVAVAILGIITGMSIPLIRNVQMNNDQKKYRSYGDTLISAAKLYRDSYEDDLFGKKKSGCSLVRYEKLREKGFLKDFPDSNISCNSSDTLVRIVKLDGKYGYSYQLYCGKRGGNGEAINPVFQASSFSKVVDKVSKKVEEDIDSDFDGFSDEYCNITSNIHISAEPEKDLSKKTKHNILLKISSTTGIYIGSYLEYAWIRADDKEGHTSIGVQSITNWNRWVLKLDSVDKQREKILSPEGKAITVTKTISTPTNADYYLLVIKGNQVRDLSGVEWEEEKSHYKAYGIYNVASKYTLNYDSQGGSDCSSKSILQERNGDEKWGDLCTPTRNGFHFVEWNTKSDGSGDKITKDSIAISDIKVYAIWKKNQVLIKLDTNEGVLAQEHGTHYTLDGSKILKYGEEIIHRIDYGSSLGSKGLLDCNQPSYLNLLKEGYVPKEGAEWILSDGSKTYSQTTVYDSQDFCNASKEDCTVTLKVNWTNLKPAIPTIFNPTNGNWVNYNFAISVSTTTSSEHLGYWYYSYDNSTFTRYDSSYGKSSYETSPFVSERNQKVYIRVCNKNATGPNDSERCSDSATTMIRIDKTPPRISLKTRNICSRRDGRVYTSPIIKVIDDLSGLKSFYNRRNDRGSRADDFCERANASDHFSCHLHGTDYNTNAVIRDYVNAMGDKNMFKNGDFSLETNCHSMLIEFEATNVCDFAGNCTSKITDENGGVYLDGRVQPNESSGLMSCEKWSQSH